MSEQSSPPPPTPSSSKTSTPKPKVFKPRAGIQRKSKAEREEYAKAEAERATARAIAAAQASADREKAAQLQQQSKTRIKKEGKDGGAGPSFAPGGVFGAGSGSAPGRRVVKDVGRSELLEGGEAKKPAGELGVDTNKTGTSGSGGTGGGTGEGGSGGGGGGGGSGGGRKVPADNMDFEVDEEVDLEPKRDIERIWISSDEDQEQDIIIRKGKAKANVTKSSGRSAGLRPVRAPRLIEEIQQVGSTPKGKDRQIKSNRTVQDDAEADQVDEDVMELDEDQFNEQEVILKQDIPSSPELSRRKLGKRPGVKTKDSRIATETTEERAERLRLNEDVQKLREEFVVTSKVKAPKQAEDVEMDAMPNLEADKMFLFQFPPLVPYLADSENMPTTNEESLMIKKDPDDPTANATMPPPDSGSKSTIPTPATGLLTANETLRLPAGRVGKLRIHKSGKVSLDWGGTDMEIRYGTEVNFLQDAVLVETSASARDDGTESNDRSSNGIAYALGQVQKKMVVIPDWQKLYD